MEGEIRSLKRIRAINVGRKKIKKEGGYGNRMEKVGLMEEKIKELERRLERREREEKKIYCD